MSCNKYVLEHIKNGKTKEGTTFMKRKSYKNLLYGMWRIKSWDGD